MSEYTDYSRIRQFVRKMLLFVFAAVAVLGIGEATVQLRTATTFDELEKNVLNGERLVGLGGHIIVSRTLQVSHSMSICTNDSEGLLDGRRSVEILTVQAGAHLMIEGVTIKDSAGSAITVERGGVLDLVECTIMGSSEAYAGGAISATQAIVRAFDTTFFQNLASFGGAVALFDRSILELVGCDLKMNAAHMGGAIFSVQQGIVNSSNSHFEGNEALNGFRQGAYPSRGGVAYLAHSENTTFEKCDFHRNAAGEGGGLAAFGSTIQIWSTTFVGNVAVSGAAMAVEEVELIGGLSVIDSNTAVQIAGGILAVKSSVSQLDFIMTNNEPDNFDEFKLPLSKWLTQVPDPDVDLPTSTRQQVSRRLATVTEAPTFQTPMPTS